MDDAKRFRLLGKYRTPRFRYGRKVLCEVRDEVTICGMTDAPIPWPVGKGDAGRPSLVVFKDLVKAIRRESNQAVAHWWGVDVQTVSKWRRLLGVARANEGTHRLHSDYTQEPWAVRAWAKAHAQARDPRHRAKIAAAKRGKPRPPARRPGRRRPSWQATRRGDAAPHEPGAQAARDVGSGYGPLDAGGG
jgi:hypothetical protein